MKRLRKSKALKVISAFLAVSLIAEIGSPAISWALTSGPAQPEFSSFEPVTTTNMVDPFSGGFTYNLPVVDVPGPNGGGYSMSLSYHSGVTPEEEASWCGLGWTMNAGAVNRALSGFPDDYNNQKVKYYHKNPANVTISAMRSSGLEIMDAEEYQNLLDQGLNPLAATTNLGLNQVKGVRFNNYRGLSSSNSFGASFLDGIASMNFSVESDGSHSFDGSINYSAALNKYLDHAFDRAYERLDIDTGKKLERTEKRLHRLYHIRPIFGHSLFPTISSSRGAQQFPSVQQKTEGYSVQFAFNVQSEPLPINIGFEKGGIGSFSRQKSKEDVEEIDAFGSMYLANASLTDATDFTMEKDAPFHKRTKMLPIPFHSKDHFMVTGEGVLGGFKLHHRDIGHLHKKAVTSTTEIANGSLEIVAGVDNGGGANLGVGTQYLSIENWEKKGNTDSWAYSSQGDEPTFFRYGYDGADNLVVTNNPEPFSASIGTGKRFPKIQGLPQTVTGDRIARSSFIDYTTNAEVKDVISGNGGEDVHYRAYSKSQDFYGGVIDRDASSNSQGLAEFSTVNSSGQEFVYGLPVYTADQATISYGTRLTQPPVNSLLIYNDNATGNLDADMSNDLKKVNGQLMETPFARSFLLTEIHSPDYIDRTFDGPSNDDFGGWTKFEYAAEYGGNGTSKNDWFEWRSPYRGLAHNRGELSDRKDDGASVSSGKKEIYYLKKIVTKTHCAYFVVNNESPSTYFDLPQNHPAIAHLGSTTNLERFDGISAPSEGDALNESNSNAHGSKKQKRLEKVVLFALGEDGKPVGKPLKITHLEYDYHLCQGVPTNSESYVPGALPENTGKLTLKKVWFEYNGIKSARIRPYEFSYEYKPVSEYGPKVTAKYGDIIEHGVNGATVLSENPDYDLFGSDAWGNHRYEGNHRTKNMMPWVKQTQVADDFDPAAWHLKRIKLPTGGEVLVQYEQHEYAKVMDRQALQFVSLTDRDYHVLSAINGTEAESFTLNLDDVDLGGMSPSEYVNFLNNDYFDKGNRLFFKLLYELQPDFSQSSADVLPEHCNVEYISGYANGTASLSSDGTDVIITVSGSTHEIPRHVCVDYVAKNRQGLPLFKNCYREEDPTSGEALNNGFKTAFMYLANIVKQKFALSGAPLTSKVLSQAYNQMYCLDMSKEFSYLRLPVPNVKRGGGVRVKRILMYDKGIEQDRTDPNNPIPGADEVLYGTEYNYIYQDGTCSGVATNEPSVNRDECALVTFSNERAPQTMWNKVISGKDREQFEGPYGESLLPGPAVNYGSVITQAIHQGQTAAGYVQFKYHTYAEPHLSLVNPMNWDYTDLGPGNNSTKFNPPDAGLFGSGFKADQRWDAQGYVFIQHDKHGKMYEQSTYAGVFSPGALGTPESSVTYNYSNPKDKFSVLDPSGHILNNQSLGVEEEIAMEMSQVRDELTKYGAQVDADINTALFPNGAGWPTVQHAITSHSRHVTSKILRYKTFLLGSTATQDGIVNHTDNLVFSKTTGTPVVTRTSDGYDNLEEHNIDHSGKYINYAVPASYVYKHLGPKAQNQGYVIDTDIPLYSDCIGSRPSWLGDDLECHQMNSFINLLGPDDDPTGINWPTYPKDGTGGHRINNGRDVFINAIDKGFLVEGDLVRLSDGNDKALFYIAEIDLDFKHRIALQPLSFVANDLIDSPMPPTFTRLEVLRSGYQNQLDIPAASFATYGKEDLTTQPLLEKGQDGSITFGSGLDGLVSLGVSQFSDDWYDETMTSMYDGLEYSCKDPHSFENGTKGKWRPQSAFVYSTSASPSSANGGDGEKVYDGGLFAIPDGEGFVFKGNVSDAYLENNGEVTGQNNFINSKSGEFLNEPINNDSWIQSSRVVSYSPHGEPLQEENAIDVRSAAKFGYGESVPTLVAGNAPLYTVAFESFETSSDPYMTTDAHHAGEQSMKLPEGKWNEIASVEAVKSLGKENEILMKAWVKPVNPEDENVADQLSFEVRTEGGATLSFPVYKIAQVRDWYLVEGIATGLDVADEEYYDPENKRGRAPGIIYATGLKNTGNAPVYIDDYRVQPTESEMTAYVYDAQTLRLLATFDSQHFGLYYQYNAEGQLVRKLVETERGIKSITETQYNIPSQARQ